jgi:hypothetical protein
MAIANRHRILCGDGSRCLPRERRIENSPRLNWRLRCSILKSRPEVEMYATPQEVWAAFVAISAGGCVILLGRRAHRPPKRAKRPRRSLRNRWARADAVVHGGHSFASGAAVWTEQGPTGKSPVDVPARRPRGGAAIDRKAWLLAAEGRTRRRGSSRPLVIGFKAACWGSECRLRFNSSVIEL